ncbi:MAG: hypothetical protein KIS81_08010 [Maricaulaceae bacterium]|nr:hypothetical protein [Maricaulaceae bacterium]
MILGRKSGERLRERNAHAERTAAAAMRALEANDVKAARHELAGAPKRPDFSPAGWKLALAAALIDLRSGKARQGLQKLADVVRRLDETGLNRDEMGYMRLYALYRAIEASKDGKAPPELRDEVEDFRFDHTLVSGDLKALFPLKKTAQKPAAPPPMAQRGDVDI